jgi:hypothetical protein
MDLKDASTMHVMRINCATQIANQLRMGIAYAMARSMLSRIAGR